MKSNFEFLSLYWPDMAEIGKSSESYLYSDSNACIYKLGMLAERITNEICNIEKIELIEDNTQVNKLKVLKREGFLPDNIDNICYSIRKARNEAVHTGLSSKEKAETLLKMAYTLCCWFMEVYGDWNFKPLSFIMPEDRSNEPDYEERLKIQEDKITELSSQIEQILTLASNKSREERVQQAEVVSESINFSKTEEDYLLGEQVRIEINASSVVNYAIQQNGIPIIQNINIVNNSDMTIEDVDLFLSSSQDLFEKLTKHIECIPANSTFEVKDIELQINGNMLVNLTERIVGDFNCELIREGTVISFENVRVTILAYDEWQGYGYYPELISAFVTPNHPEIIKIIARAADLLGNWTGDPSLDAYQSQDINRVIKQAGAVYSALHEQSIVYSVPPASFEKVGQRVRLCDAVLQQKLGTCLDLSILYASCLEAIGLNPLLIIQKGHMFAGFWLEDTSFSESIQDDASLVTKRLADGINEIEVVECTAFVTGRDQSFDEARKMAVAKMQGVDSIECVIDVKRARLSGIKPIPMRILTENGWRVKRDSKDDSSRANIPSSVMETINTDSEQTPASRKLRWERKLLDIGLRNTLISLRLSKTVVPILTASLDELENALSDGSDFSVTFRPIDWHLSEEISFDTMHELGGYAQLIESEFKNKRLRSILTETELEKNIKEIYRAAKSSIEENGANTLYLAMGLIRWFENPRSTKSRYAPIILLPVEMVRKSVSQGYVIRLRDEDPQVNITMIEKLKQDFGIVIDGVDPLPLDEHGVDTRKVFTIIRKAIMEQKNWDVLESAYLGIFSFSQFVMWNDIRNRADDLEKNEIVKSLIEGKLCMDIHDMDIPEKVSEEEAFLPIPADASQLFAIEQAGKGASFVLHGPPGTGKSQTITALIANALAQGKTVLFVAEKMAALEVVQKRLKNIGLDPFCLELHSNKSKKKDVLEQLRQATEVTKHETSEKFLQRAEQIASIRKELDDYSKALHKKQPCGLSLYELINEYEANKTEKNLKAFDSSVISSMNQDIFERQTILIERLVAAAKEVGHPYNHPLRPIGCKEYSQQMRILIPKVNEEYKSRLKDIKPIVECVSSEINLPKDSYANLQLMSKISKELLFWGNIPESWAKKDNFYLFSENILKLADASNEATKAKNFLLSHWKEEFLSQDGKALVSEYQSISSKWALAKSIGINKLTNRLMIYKNNSTKPSSNDLSNYLMALACYQTNKEQESIYLNKYEEELSNFYKGKDTDWNFIIETIKYAENSSEFLRNATGSDDFRKNYCGRKNNKDCLFELNSKWDKVSSAKEEFYSLFKIQDRTSDNWIDDELELISIIEKHYNDIKEWITWNSISFEAIQIGLWPVINAYYNGMPHEDIVRAYKREICQELAMKAIDQDKALNSFTGSVFNEKIEQFKKMDAELIMLTKQEIYCRLASKVPNFTKEAAQSSELGILQRAIKSNGRGLSIRKLFEQIPNMLPRLCPCMLMSPLSAAQYLDPKREPFDLVVFDEASQLPTCKAVGALARGKNAVIVGDPKQMPPTSFFSTNTIDEENIETEDLESILDDCLALNMPQTHLLWHYRSRHESLIAFSNHEFYDNKLYTFPSANDRERKVHLKHIDGVFDRGKTRQNRAEAEAIVSEIVKRCHDAEFSKQSIGVVTFNVLQQNLIDDLFTEACKKDETLENWAFNSEEPLFIKNLESVQGDERDVILFSVGYGPDSSGKVSMNFGPLNRDGGWRRLNVAVSRARMEMMVFSSLSPEQINLSRTSAEGVAALKSFLEYASGNDISEDENSAKLYTEDSTGILDAICKELKKAGYDTDRMVGHSEYKIDIGVIDPENTEQYLCGILLDGNAYGKAKTSRDREIAQISVLNGLGWRILRIWSMDWWDNPDKEIKRIIEFIENNDNNPDDTKGKGPYLDDNINEDILEGNDSISFEENTLKKTVSEAKDYSICNLPYTYIPPEDFVSNLQYLSVIKYRISEIIKCEAPICVSLLSKRLVQSLGISRTGSRIQNKIDEILKSEKVRIVYSYGQNCCWRTDQDPLEYNGLRANTEGNAHRDIREVPIQELANAVCFVLFEQISLPDDDLARESAKLMKYTRMGSNVLPAFERSIDYARRNGFIEKKENGVWVLSELGNQKAESVAKSMVTKQVDSINSQKTPTKNYISWQKFYDDLFDKELSENAVFSRISRLENIGPSQEVCDVLSELICMYESEKLSLELLKKASSFGFELSISDLINFDSCGYEFVNEAIKCAPKGEWSDRQVILSLLEAFFDYDANDLFFQIALDNGIRFTLSEISKIYDNLSDSNKEYVISNISDSKDIGTIKDLYNFFLSDFLLSRTHARIILQKAISYGFKLSFYQIEELVDYGHDFILLALNALDDKSWPDKQTIKNALKSICDEKITDLIVSKSIDKGVFFSLSEIVGIYDIVSKTTLTRLLSRIFDNGFDKKEFIEFTDTVYDEDLIERIISMAIGRGIEFTEREKADLDSYYNWNK